MRVVIAEEGAHRTVVDIRPDVVDLEQFTIVGVGCFKEISHWGIALKKNRILRQQQGRKVLSEVKECLDVLIEQKHVHGLNMAVQRGGLSMLSLYNIQVQFCEHKRARCGIPPWIASVRAPLENPHDEHDNKNTTDPDHVPDFEKDKAYPDPTVASLEKLAEPCAKRRRCRVVDPDSVDLEQAAVVDPERGREEAIDPGQVLEQQDENIRSRWAAYRASTEKPRGKTWDAECRRQKRAQL